MATKPKNRRSQELSVIHVLRGKLRMSEDSYRAMLAEQAGVTSAAQLASSTARQRIIDHLRGIEREMGLSDRPARKQTSRRGSEMDFRDDDEPRVKKVRMMWLALHDSDAAVAPTAVAMNRWVKRQTGIDTVDWLEASALNKIIEELKEWHKRLGIAE